MGWGTMRWRVIPWWTKCSACWRHTHSEPAEAAIASHCHSFTLATGIRCWARSGREATALRSLRGESPGREGPCLEGGSSSVRALRSDGTIRVTNRSKTYRSEAPRREPSREGELEASRGRLGGLREGSGKARECYSGPADLNPKHEGSGKVPGRFRGKGLEQTCIPNMKRAREKASSEAA